MISVGIILYELGGVGCDLLPGHRASFCVGIVDPFLDGFHENRHVSAGRRDDDGGETQPRTDDKTQTGPVLHS